MVDVWTTKTFEPVFRIGIQIVARESGTEYWVLRPWQPCWVQFFSLQEAQDFYAGRIS